MANARDVVAWGTMMDANSASDALREELLRHARWLERLARHLVREEEAAADLAQDTFLAALRRPPERLAELRPWLARVMHNRHRDLGRRQDRRRNREAVAAAPETQPDTNEAVERLDLEQGLLDAVRGLDEPFRTAVTLRYLEGLEPAEIARRQGIPGGTVRWRVSEGLARLRSTLDAERGGRDRWLPLFLPLAGLPATELQVGATAGTSTLLLGTLVMKLTLAAVALAIVVLFVWHGLTGGVDSDLTTRRNDVSPTNPAAAVEAGPGIIGAQVESDAARTPVEVVADEVPAVPTPDVYPVRLRVIDEEGRPLTGVRVRTDDELPLAADARTDGDGRLEVRWENPARGRGLTLRLFAPEREHLELPREEIAGDALDLGTITLRRGTSVAGRVVDEAGMPRKGARVTADDGAVALIAENFASTVTDEAGRFRFEGLPVGFVRLRARLDGTRRGGEVEKLLALEPGLPVSDVELTVTGPEGPGRTEGIVRRPDGTPSPNAELMARAENETSSGTFRVDVDDTGRFVIEGWRYDEYELSAVDRDDPALRVRGVLVTRGDIGIELRLASVDLVTLEVRDPAGVAVEEYSARFVLAREDGNGETSTSLNTARVDGTRRFAPPEVPYSVEIRCPGFHTGRSEVFDPEAGRATVALVLVPLPRVTGVVRRDGRAFAGAHVQLRRGVFPSSVVHVDGLRCEWDEVESSPVATTDADGAFAIPYRPPSSPRPPSLLDRLRGRGVEAPPPFAVAVDAGEKGGAFVAPLLLDRDDAPPALDIDLVPGGTIEGRLRRADGLPPTECWIVAGDARSAVRAVRPDEDGTFRFTHLPPGPWQVKNLGPNGKPMGVRSSSGGVTPSPVTWDCDVRSGEVTRFDIDERDATRLAGRLRVDEHGPGPWTVILWRASETPGERVRFAGMTSLTADGRFAFTPSTPGRHELALHGTLGTTGVMVELSVPLEVFAGPNDWSLDLRVATMTGRCASEVDVADLQLRAALPGGGVWMVALVPGDDGSFRAAAPPGPVEIVRANADDPLGKPREVLRRLDLEADGAEDVLVARE